MSLFLDKFPKVSYDINNALRSNYETVTDLLFRVSIIKDVLNSVSAYYEYTITESDSPEILAEKVYGNPEAHWIILYTNDIYDPQYDWPLNYDEFRKYIIKKYGSEANAQTTIHHYEKIIAREVNNSGIILLERIPIDYQAQTTPPSGVPYDTYLTLPATPTYTSYTVDGKNVVEAISRAAITNYDWELQNNENKRKIKIIKKEYYPQIMQEFNDLVGVQSAFVRRLV